jgi:hypothetical protein
MIALSRIRTADAIPDEFYGAKRIARNLELLKSKIKGDFDGTKAMSSVWKSAIWDKAKDQLLIESNGKCAYCESPTSVVAYGDVEHFRPKSKYWWLAYCYENYLPACTVCNQRYKRDEFALKAKAKPWTGPDVKKGMTAAQLKALAKAMTADALNDGDGMAMKLFTDTMTAEGALLVHPYFQNPEDYFAYKPIVETNEVIIVPLKSATKAIVDACDKFFGINRQELRDERYRHYATYMTFRQTLAVPNLPDKLKKNITKRIAEMTSGKLRYTGMIRYFETKKLEDLPWDFEV